MTHASPTLQRLLAETRTHQCVSDADALALIAGPSTREAYRDFLVKLYGFETPIETALSIVPELTAWLGPPRPRRASLLAADLVALDLPPERMLDLRTCRIERFHSTCEALGWLYVLERNVTSQQLLRGYLARRAPGLEHATAYITAHERRSDPWLVLGKAFDHFAKIEPAGGDAIVRAARAAYDCQHRWLRPTVPTASVILAGQETASRVIRSIRRVKA